MELKVKRLTRTAKLPQKAHAGDLCWDLFADENTVLMAGQTVIVKTNIAIQPPPGYGAVICERSGLATKGIIVGAGQIDHGYRGPIGVVIRFLYDNPDECFYIDKGDKIAQLKLEKIIESDIVEADELDDTVRGEDGFGSTGK